MHPTPSRAALLLLAASLAAPAGAEPLRLPGEALKAVRDFDEAADRLARARAALAAVENRDTPKGAPEDWAGAPAAIEAAAEALRRAEGPEVPAPADFGVPDGQLRSCATRAGALTRLERQAKAAQAAAQRCAETRAWLRERQAVAQAAEENRKALVKGGQRLSDEPALGEWFTWRWSELDKGLAAAVAGYGGELRKLQEKVDRAQGELRTRAGALSSQAAEVGRARDCLLSGQWVGTRALAGTVSALTVQLAAAGPGWSGTANLDGADLPVRSVTIAGNAVTVILGDRRVTLNGTLSGDGRVYKGTCTSIDGQAAFSLRKQ